MYKAMIRVTHVINSLGIGGAERFLCDLALQLDPELFQQQVLCLYKAGEFLEILQTRGVAVRVLGLGREVRPRGWLQVWQMLRGLEADILHAHLPEACWYALPTAWLAGIPVRIAHLQNTHCYWPVKLRWMDRAAATFATGAVACSGAVRNFYQERLHYPAAKVAVIHSSVDIQRFRTLSSRIEARQRLNLPKDGLILVCVASLTEQKGHRYLLEAMREVSAAFPETLLLLVGDGELREQLEQGARQKLLNGTVRFLGRRMDIPLLLAASDLFVLSSLWEGLPLVLAEAAAAGVPAVATNVDGIPEVIDDGVTGLLVPPQNSEVLAAAILTLLRNPEHRIEIGKRAHQLINERFSMSRIARDVESLYFELLTAVHKKNPRV
jgi:glycosyltransferase involved in cell wall biosynthesis